METPGFAALVAAGTGFIIALLPIFGDRYVTFAEYVLAFPGSGLGSAALGVGAGLVGMPYACGTGRPNAFSCHRLDALCPEKLRPPGGAVGPLCVFEQNPNVTTPHPVM
jgi:hypothetical protein